MLEDGILGATSKMGIGITEVQVGLAFDHSYCGEVSLRNTMEVAHTHPQRHTHIHRNTHTHPQKHTHIRRYTHTSAETHTHPQKHTHTSAETHTHPQKHTHTHKQTPGKKP